MTPNLFVLGAGKSGTTSLYNALGQFPDVQVTDPKEPSFFCSYFNVIGNPIDYFNLFDSSFTWRCDCSHVYFSNPESALVISSLFPNAKFILILRDPIQRAYSLYNFMRKIRHADGQPMELTETFLQALREEDSRMSTPDFFENCRQYYWNFLYCESSRYDVQLKKYMDIYPREQFHFLSLAEFSHGPEKCLESIAKFLDTDLPQNVNVEAKNIASYYGPACAESTDLLKSRLAGVTDRADALIGRDLDWSI